MEHCFSERWDIYTSNEVYCSHCYEDFFQGYTVPKNPVKYEFPAICMLKMLFSKMTDYIPVIFWVSSSILDLTQNLDPRVRSSFWVRSSQMSITDTSSGEYGTLLE